MNKVYASSTQDVVFYNIIQNLKSRLEFNFEVKEKTDYVGDKYYFVEIEDGGNIIVYKNDMNGAFLSTPNSEIWASEFNSEKKRILNKSLFE